MKGGTLTRRLFFKIAPTILITIAAIGGFAFYSATQQINTVYDAQLINNVNVLWMLVSRELNDASDEKPELIQDNDIIPGTTLDVNPEADAYADSRMFRIWRGKKIIMFSDTALPSSVPSRKAGFSDVIYKGETWRIYTLPIEEQSVSIEVGEKIVLRDALVAHILLELFFPLLILVPVVGALIWFGINSGLGTIRSLVQQIKGRSPEDLSPVSLEPLPMDLRPLGKSVNDLLAKLDHSLTSERRFADHAAHQLRTPLAGFKLLLQMLAKADSEQERRAILSDLITANDKASHLVEQLLNAARVSHQPIRLEAVNFYHTVAMVFADMGVLAAQKHLDVALEGYENAMVFADESLLRLLIGNLFENAIKHTPENGQILGRIVADDGVWRLSIRDTGPGIPESQRKLVFQHFYRVDTLQTEGSGLGLAIVAEIVERIGGRINLKSPESGQGLLVEVFLQKA